MYNVNLKEIQKAHEFLKPYINETPTKESMGLPGVYLKCENMQKTGSFKVRGALYKISQLTKEEKERGVIASSAGNHAQGVALGAKLFGVNAKIVMPEGAPLTKIQNTQGHGAEVILHGAYFDMAYEKAVEICEKEGRVFVHPYSDEMVMCGQGTIGLEILNVIPDVERVVIPIGGGGLISGIATAIKAINPNCEIVGVVPEDTPGMKHLKEGVTSQPKKSIKTIADGLAVKNPNENIFKQFIGPHVSRVVAVNDGQIAEAIVHLMEKDKIVVEGSGAAGYAALLSGVLKSEDKKTCVVLCGGNIDLNTIQSVIETGLRQKGRLRRLSVIVDDLPGSLAQLTSLMAEQKANVLDVMHDRVSPELSLRETRIDFVLETTGPDHIESILKALSAKGIRHREKNPGKIQGKEQV